MELIRATNEFAVRLYDWSLEDFIREMREGCPLLSLIGLHHRSIGGFVLWSQELTQLDQKQLAIAMTLMFHENARKLKGLDVTDEIKHTGEMFYDQTTAHKNSMPPLLTADRTAPSFRRPDANRLLEVLASSLSPDLGQAKRRGSKIICTRRINDWKITTEFEYQRQRENLYFEYQFVRTDGFPVLEAGHGPFPRNLFAFYGIYPRTFVGVPSEADGELMAKAMAILATHFVSKAEPLFSGLGLND